MGEDEKVAVEVGVIEKAETSIIKDASDDEGELAFMGAAVLCNRLYIHSGGAFVRLGFGEQARDSTPVHFRAAVALTLEQAWDLRDMLDRTLSRI